jgi:hypothetical protein
MIKRIIKIIFIIVEMKGKKLFIISYPQYSIYLYMMTAIPMAIAANNTDVMSIIERHKAKPMNDRILREKIK